MKNEVRDEPKTPILKQKLQIGLRTTSFNQLCVLAALAIMTFLIMMYSTQSIWKKTEPWTDSSVFKYIALVMSRGGMPYADAFDHKGPIIYLLNLLGMQIAYMRGIWVVEFICMFGTLLSMYKVSRLFCGRLASCISVLICGKYIFDYFQYGNFTEEYAMLPICVSTFIFLDYMLNDKVNKVRLTLCGLCFASVCLLRANMVAVWVVFCAVIFVKLLWVRDWITVRKFVIHFVLGMCMLFVPIFLWLGVNGAFDDFVQNYLVFNLTYSTEAGGRAFASAKWNAFVYFFNQDIVLYAVMILIYLIVRGEKRLVAGTYLSYVFLMFALLCMSGMKYGHYGLMIVPTLVYPISYLIHIAEANYKKKKNPLILVAVMYFLVTLAAPTWVNAVNNVAQTFEKREESNYKASVQKVLAIIKANSEVDEPISVYGNWNAIYVLSERISNSKYSYQFPIGTIDPSIMDRYFEDIREENPKVIVIQENRMDVRMETFLKEYGYGLVYNEKKDGSGCQVYSK